jgi:hypothetical protein
MARSALVEPISPDGTIGANGETTRRPRFHDHEGFAAVCDAKSFVIMETPDFGCRERGFWAAGFG